MYASLTHFGCLVIPEKQFRDGVIFTKLFEKLRQRDGTSIHMPIAILSRKGHDDIGVADRRKIQALAYKPLAGIGVCTDVAAQSAKSLEIGFI